MSSLSLQREHKKEDALIVLFVLLLHALVLWWNSFDQERVTLPKITRPLIVQEVSLREEAVQQAAPEQVVLEPEPVVKIEPEKEVVKKEVKPEKKVPVKKELKPEKKVEAKPKVEKKPVAKKVTPAAKKTTEKDKAKAKLIADAKKSLAALGKGGGRTLKTAIPLEVDALSSADFGWGEEISEALRRALVMPEKGDVTVELVVLKTGRVSKVLILKAASAKNKSYIEEKLHQLQFPISPNGREGTFIITLSHEN